jgi:hypothetical protein
MSKLEALRALHDAVKAGRACPDFCPMWHSDGHCMEAEAAFSGSIDAAHALHRAVLPGWVWNVVMDGCTVWRDYPENPMDGVQDEYCEGNPARAWLLAIISALIAQEEAA